MLKCWQCNNILVKIILYFLYRMENSSVCFLCDNKCGVKCPHCEQVFICSDDHSKVHRSGKKCLPWVVKFQEGVGRTLVASRDIFPFELIMKDDPLVTVQDLTDICVNCEDKIEGNIIHLVKTRVLYYLFLSLTNITN
jgi:hypothetical protein